MLAISSCWSGITSHFGAFAKMVIL
uniref:Uncharacterized protein n=1 Tax=Physcomitrium patens TaxID=3218 RepID=A0A2K1KQD3_PHYPA|nr:hypothetical protein PHYPA_006876 [Physcomitrium patens]